MDSTRRSFEELVREGGSAELTKGVIGSGTSTETPKQTCGYDETAFTFPTREHSEYLNSLPINRIRQMFKLEVTLINQLGGVDSMGDRKECLLAHWSEAIVALVNKHFRGANEDMLRRIVRNYLDSHNIFNEKELIEYLLDPSLGSLFLDEEGDK